MQEPDPRRWLVLAVMSVGTLLVFLDDTVVNTALPTISVDLDASTSALQWVIDAYVLVLAGLLLLCGSIGDRFGRRRIMSLGLVVFGVGAVLAALADSTTVLITARAVQGLGAAMVLPATLSIITTVFPRHERSKAIAVWTAVGGIGVGLGPVLGGWLVDHADWSAAFYLFVPLVVAGLVGMTVVPESRDTRGVGLDVPGAVVGTAALTALVFGIIRGGETGWGETSVVASLAAAVVLLVAFVAVERVQAAPMLPMALFRERDFTGAVALIGIVLFSMFVTFFFLTQFFQLVQGRSALEAGALIVAAAAGMIVGSGASGKLLPTVGPRPLAVAMPVLCLIGLGLLTGITEGTSAWGIAGALGIIGLAAGLGMPAMTDTVMAAVPEHDAGVGSAVNDVSRQLGGALGIAVVGSVVNSVYRSNLDERLPADLPAGVADAARESVGIAGQAAASLPPATGRTLVEVANGAFVDAITTGFVVSAGTMVVALVVAVTMIPKRMRTHQAGSGVELVAQLAGVTSSASTSPVPASMVPAGDAAGPS